MRLWLIAPILAALALLMALSAAAQTPPDATLYYYRDGQAVAVERRTVLSGGVQDQAWVLLSALALGPTPEEQGDGLTSPLPAGTEIVAVTVSGDEVTVDLRLPQPFLRDELDVPLCDAVVEQIDKTLHPLALNRLHVRAEDESGILRPLSSFLPPVTRPAPEIPPNDDQAPAGATPEYVGQPPAMGQGQPQGALSGKTVWLSAGHGWYWSDLLDRWNTARPNTYGIVEDFANAEAVNYYLARYLWNAGADVWLVRERSMIDQEVVVDDDQGAPAFTQTGTWALSASTGYNGGGYRYATSYASQTSTATWTPTLPTAGWYAVWAWYRHGANRPSDVRYQIHHAGGMTTVSLSQQVHGQTWRYLGEYYFEAGAAGRVTLINLSNDPGLAVIADAVRFGGGLGSIPGPNGPSQEPRWEEQSALWAQYQGAPAEILDNDVTVRPLYAEWETAKGYPGEAANAVFVSWHTNAGGGTGTNSYIHDTLLPTGSVELQDWVHAELVGDLKAAWNPLWVDRGQKAADFGELRELSQIPGVLLEVAFHDTEDPGDADDLRQPVFRQIAARAVYQGIVKYFADRDGQTALLLPEPPTHLTARNSGEGQITVQWNAPPCGGSVVGDAATRYKVYHSANGRAFDNGVETDQTSRVMSGLAPGSLHFFRVTALNAGGESFPTATVAARTPPTGGTADLLIVDGFERLDESALIPQWESAALGTAQRMFLDRMNRYDYAVEHALALDVCQRAFDGTSNEAVVAGGLSLAGYEAVDWFTGEDSEADASLDGAERTLLRAYLDGGGRLLISGSEIGYDLVELGRDPAFFQTYLRASYLGDDAQTYAFSGLPGGPFEGLGGAFDNSTQGAYDPAYPDRLGAANGSTVVLSYAGGTGDGAAVAYDGAYGLVYAGFPLETITDPALRNDLLCAAVSFLAPRPLAGLALSPSQSGWAYPGQTAVYTHTLVNSGEAEDTYQIGHASSQGWTVAHPPLLTVPSGLSATVRISVAVPADAHGWTVDRTRITATSQNDSTVTASVTDTTTVSPTQVATPRLINPGFEGGAAQSAWRLSAPGGPALTSRDDLPSYVAPHGGDWLARFQPQSPALPAALTQTVALPSGEPAAALHLAWFVHPEAEPATTAADSLTVRLLDADGAPLTMLLSLSGDSTADQWLTGELDLSAYSGQTVQLVVQAATAATQFFVDDVQLITSGLSGPEEMRALWVDAYHDGIRSRQQIDELVETAQAGNMNALVVQVLKRGDTYYPSDLNPWAANADPTFDALAYLIARAHAAGLEVHAWATSLAIWNGDTPPAAPDHVFNTHGPTATGRDYWLMTNEVGAAQVDGVWYLDPGHPDVVDYLAAVYAELATRYDLDGIHLDRIRYPGNTRGYNPTALARFQAQTGRSDTPAPLDGQWRQWRRDQLTALVRRIYLTVAGINPRIRVSAALSSVGYAPTPAYGWETREPFLNHLQDWRAWMEEGILDLALPMIYRNESKYPGQFDDWQFWAKDHQYDRGLVVGTGLYLNPLADSMGQWLSARRPSAAGHRGLGISGYSYATPSSLADPRRVFVNAAVTDVYTRPAPSPALPWKERPTVGHLTGRLALTLPCAPTVDGRRLTLTGPEDRSLSTDGSGWFGAVDLPPGAYLLTAEHLATGLSPSQTLTITAGGLTDVLVEVDACPDLEFVYVPLILKATGP